MSLLFFLNFLEGLVSNGLPLGSFVGRTPAAIGDLDAS